MVESRQIEPTSDSQTPDRIVVHGNNKSVVELAAALDAGVGRIVLDSFTEIARPAPEPAWLESVTSRLTCAIVAVCSSMAAAIPT